MAGLGRVFRPRLPWTGISLVRYNPCNAYAAGSLAAGNPGL